MLTNPGPSGRRFPLPPPGPDPFVVEVRRGALAESRHRVLAVVADADGAVVAAWGDGQRPIYPRSAVKPLQALPLVESGAADACGLSAAELALACASHGGESVHTCTVASWLGRLGLGPADLECGSHPPYHAATAEALVARGEAPSALHNNCSGKHAGMLTTARQLGEPTAGYVRADHPVQRRIAAVLEEMCRAPVAAAGIDGCSIPTLAQPLAALATGMARFVAPDGLPPARAAACRRIAAAMLAEPGMVAGDGRFCTTLMRAAAGRIVAKGGAEGVYLAGLPARGLGLALKVEDGAPRAAEAGLAALLDWLDALDDGLRVAIAGFAAPRLSNRRGQAVGEIVTIAAG
jgi:L-asparaginase II